MTRALVLLIAFGGCVKSSEVVCSDGRLCPPGYTCDDANMRCLSTEQVAACSGREEGAECTIAGAPGACRSGACDPLVCGDGVRAVGEACDGSDLGDATCRDAGFYDSDGLACTSFCTFDVSGCSGFCGDQIINGLELCDGAPPPGACVDYGFDAGAISCGNFCGLSFEACARFGWVPESTTLSTALAFDATAPSDVWAAGRVTAGPAIAHYNGSTWSHVLLAGDEEVVAIAAASPTDAWIIRDPLDGGATTLDRYTNGTWTSISGAPAARYKELWAVGTHLYVATSDAGVLHFDGTTWQPLGTLSDPLVKIEGTKVDNIFAVGATGTLWHWNGTNWQSIAVDMAVTGIDPVAENDLWAIGASTITPTSSATGHWDGTQWTLTLDSRFDPSFGTTYTAIGATAANDAWVALPAGMAQHFSGQSWSQANQIVLDPTYGAFIDIIALPDTRLAITFDGYVYRYHGQMYARFATQSTNPLIASVSFTPSNTVAFDNKNFAYHFNGNTWTKKAVDPAASPQSNRVVWGRAPDDLWVGGVNGLIFRYDGNAWTDSGLNAGGTIQALVGFSATDAWVFALQPLHYDGVTLTAANGTFPTMTAASASGPNDIWTVGTTATGSEIWHYNGAAWMSMPLVGSPKDILALAPNNVFAAGENRIWHYDGTTWTEQLFAVLDPFIKLSATAPNDVFALTAHQLAHFDGERWAFIHSPADIEVLSRPMTSIDAHRDRIDIVYGSSSGSVPLRRLIRTRLWNCADGETVCDDGVDDDCDNAVDALDTDCP